MQQTETTPALKEADHAAIASQLDEAERTRQPIRQVSLVYPDMGIQDSYAIQRAWTSLKASRGRRVNGHKIGLTSRAMQRAVNISEPDYGVLLDDMFLEDGVTIEAAQLIQPRVEVELAFVLKRDLTGPDCTMYDVLNATDFVTPAIEILDARIQRIDPETRRTRTVLDTIADNAANCALILGGRPIRPMDFDLRWVSAICYRNAQIEETGVAAGVLNHPAMGIAWLANRIFAYGDVLKSGEVVLAGSFIRPVEASAGDTFYADYGTFGTVTCQFT